MSFFLASVPEGVQLYHGTGREERVRGMEWLAFEPEHALNFAHGQLRGPPPGRGKNKTNESGEKGGEAGHDRKERRGVGYGNEDEDHNDTLRDEFVVEKPSSQHIIGPDQPPLPPGLNETGYFHVYRTKHALNLLLIDGMSAGKTLKGTLDSQDYILRLNRNGSEILPFGDYERGLDLCNISRNFWDSRVDGFIRMEAGFEILLCDFEAHLELERAQAVKRTGIFGGFGDPAREFRFYRAVADRFDGIGGGRVIVDFANMMSAFRYGFGDDLFEKDPEVEQVIPRLMNQSELLLREVQDGVTRMVMDPIRPLAPVDWQGVADLFVQRYAAPLQYLVSADLSTKNLKSELAALLRPFASDETKDTSVVATRCVEQFLPAAWPESFAGQVVREIGWEVCNTLVDALDMLSENTGKRVRNLETCGEIEGNGEKGIIKDLQIQIFSEPRGQGKSARQLIQSLIERLDWPIWRECRPSCNYGEVCVIPIWPVTTIVDDRKQPKCKNEAEYNKGRYAQDDYWCNGPCVPIRLPPRRHD